MAGRAMKRFETAPVSAAVLAGGQSRRMGTDKALLEFDGVALLSRALQAVSAVSDDVYVVGDRPAYHEFGVPVVGDAFPGSGTLGGIATALLHARHDHVLVVACDMPLLDPAVLKAMANEPRDYDILVPALAGGRSQQGGRQTYETLHAIYTKSCLPAIEARLQHEEYKVIGFFEDVSVRVIDEAWLRSLDPELRSFLNANDPAELERVLAYSRASRSDTRPEGKNG